MKGRKEVSCGLVAVKRDKCKRAVTFGCLQFARCLVTENLRGEVEDGYKDFFQEKGMIIKKNDVDLQYLLVLAVLTESVLRYHSMLLSHNCANHS